MFHTVFDQDHTLQTANEMLDITIGSYAKYKSATSTTDPEYYVCFKDQSGTPITAITAAVPMIIANAVKKDLTRLVLIDDMADFIDSSTNINQIQKYHLHVS